MSAFKKPNLKKMQAACDAFNASHPVGSKVLVKLDNHDEPFATTTHSEAQILSGHSAVIWLNGVRGCYLLDRVTAVQDEASALQADRDINAGKDSGRFEARRDATALRQQIQSNPQNWGAF